MPGANPLMEAMGGGSPPVAAEPAVGYQAPPAGGAATGSFPMSLGGFTSPDNTSTHVAVLVLAATLIVALLYWGGFSFGVDAGVMRK